MVITRAASAFVDPPALSPANPNAGQMISVSIRSGGCDGFTDYPPPVVTRSGNNIRIVIQSVWAPSGSDFCFLPVGTSLFPVGSFNAGVYSLQVDRTYLGFSGPVTETLGTLAFAVVPVASIPALGLWGKVALCIALVVALSVGRRPKAAP